MSDLICYCSVCESGICRAEKACYKAINQFDCNQHDGCFGCFNDFQEFQCNNKTSISCCSNKNYCNLNLTITKEIQNNDNQNVLTISFSIAFLLLLFLIIFLLIIIFVRRKKFSKINIRKWIENGKNVKTVHGNDTILTTTKFQEFSSGSGPIELIQRTIARDLQIDYSKPIGQGRFGVVWKAKWNEDFVAVKSFFSMHECSWSRETDIYETCMLRHENILGYIASDIKGNGHSVNMLLITEYHEIGSLYDYLQKNSINFKLLKTFSYSIINGLNHLHTEIISTKCKPAIAHRDLKTKNILVKSNFECCIADFGLAVRFNTENHKLDVGTNQIREGSQRYMAPECLNGCLNIRSIEELKCADIYSFSLVIWELIKCFREDDDDEERECYSPPYYEYVSAEPTIEQMKLIICDKQIRPSIIKTKLENKKLNEFISIIYECWQNDPSSRLKSLRIKKCLNKI